MSYRLNFRDVLAQHDFLMEGLLLTLELAFISMALGLLIGIAAAAARVYGGRWLRLAAATYVEAIRNTPLLVQLFIVFFGLPGIGLRLDPVPASVVALTINLGAYATEIVRAGIEAVPRSQIEAGVSLGLSPWQVFRWVVLVPAMRAMYPALTAQFILLLLATSIVSQISAPDLFHAGSIIQSRTFRDFEVYIVIAALYLSLSLAFRLAFAGLHRLAFARR